MQLKRERDRLQLLLEVNNAVVSHLNMNEMFVAISGACTRDSAGRCSLMLYDPRRSSIASTCCSSTEASSSKKDCRRRAVGVSVGLYA